MNCENCSIEHAGIYGSKRFCGVSCSRSFSTRSKREEINKKVSSKMSNRKLSPDHIKNIEKANNFNRSQRHSKKCLNCNSIMLCLPSDLRKFCTGVCWTNYTEKNKAPFLLYRQRCNFDFNINDYLDKFNFILVEQYGWYSPSNKGNNLNGVSKDHMLSVRQGFQLGIDPSIIKHPANCQLLLHRKNQSKREKSSITFEELLERIKYWSVQI